MERRITGVEGTIPQNTALAGTVTSNPNSDKLHYTGSDDVATIYGPSKVSAVDSPSWIWVHGAGSPGAPYLARVIGLRKLATGSYTIYLDRNFPGATAAAAAYVPGAITFGFVVDGNGSAQVCSGDKGSTLVPILGNEGDGDKAYQLYAQRIKLHAPLYVDATGTDVLINEET